MQRLRFRGAPVRVCGGHRRSTPKANFCKRKCNFCKRKCSLRHHKPGGVFVDAKDEMQLNNRRGYPPKDKNRVFEGMLQMISQEYFRGRECDNLLCS